MVAAADVVFTHVREADGRIVRTAGADLARDAEQRKAALSSTIGQSTRPELSDLASGITGEIMHVDGGQSAGY